MTKTKALQSLFIAGSLSRRLVFATVLVSILVSFIVSALQSLVSYHEQTLAAQQRLNEIETSIVPSLASSLWLVDMARVNLLLDGVEQLPTVAYLEVRSADGNVFHRGVSVGEAFASREYILRYEEGKIFELGTLRVVLSDSQIVNRLRDEALSYALTSTVALTCSSLMLLLFFQIWVTRHLATMANYVQTLNFERLNRPLTLKGKRNPAVPDELDHVVNSINLMRETMISDLEVRLRIESELSSHRERLEELVSARTVELQNLNSKLEALSTTDGLTGIANRRSFDDTLAAEWSRADRSQVPIAVAMIDVDWFKKYNDHYGHQEGDHCLRCIAKLMAAAVCRTGDLVARFGGEEFVFIAPNTNGVNAMLLAEKLCEMIRSLALKHELSDFGVVTVSVGVAAMVPSQTQSQDVLIKAADQALYQAKARGRNQVVMAITAPNSEDDTQF